MPASISPSITTTSVSTLTNKTVVDSTTTFQDNGDATKKMKLELSGISTGQTRTMTVPDANATLVGTTTSQTLTNKTIAAGSNTLSGIANAHVATNAAIDVSKLAAGTDNYVLTTVTGTPTWAAVSASGVTGTWASSTGNIATTNGANALQDSGTALTSLAPKASPTFTGLVTGSANGFTCSAPNSSTGYISTGMGNTLSGVVFDNLNGIVLLTDNGSTAAKKVGIGNSIVGGAFYVGTGGSLNCLAPLCDGTGNTYDLGATAAGGIQPFKRAFFGAKGIQIGLSSGSVADPNYHVDIRQATAATAVYSQWSITTTTGTASTDGLKVGLTSAGVAEINQQENLALDFFTNATRRWQIKADGTLANKVSGNESTGAGTAQLGTNSPASTLTAPYTWLKVETSDGSAGYIPIWK